MVLIAFKSAFLAHTRSGTRASCHCPCLGTGSLGPLWGGAIPTILTMITSWPWLESPGLYTLSIQCLSQKVSQPTTPTQSSFPSFSAQIILCCFVCLSSRIFETKDWLKDNIAPHTFNRKPSKAKNYFEITRFPAIVLKRINNSSGCILYNVFPGSSSIPW